jgi:ribonuclease HI
MASFEVFLVPVITTGAFSLKEKKSSACPRIQLEKDISWKTSLKNFIKSELGEVKYSLRLSDIKQKKGKPAVLEVHLNCALEAGQPPQPLDDRYCWEKNDTVAGGLKIVGAPDPEHEVVLFTDGASRGNPGPAGTGVLLRQEESGYEEEYCRYLGEATNNTAEYTALVDGLTLAVEKGIRRVAHRSDSELLVKQLRGEYKVKSDSLKLLLYKAKDIISALDSFSTKHLRREHNSRADELANRAIDLES